jgi:hypothetical protein
VKKYFAAAFYNRSAVAAIRAKTHRSPVDSSVINKKNLDMRSFFLFVVLAYVSNMNLYTTCIKMKKVITSYFKCMRQ